MMGGAHERLDVLGRLALVLTVDIISIVWHPFTLTLF